AGPRLRPADRHDREHLQAVVAVSQGARAGGIDADPVAPYHLVVVAAHVLDAVAEVARDEVARPRLGPADGGRARAVAEDADPVPRGGGAGGSGADVVARHRVVGGVQLDDDPLRQVPRDQVAGAGRGPADDVAGAAADVHAAAVADRYGPRRVGADVVALH